MVQGTICGTRCNVKSRNRYVLLEVEKCKKWKIQNKFTVYWSLTSTEVYRLMEFNVNWGLTSTEVYRCLTFTGVN